MSVNNQQIAQVIKNIEEQLTILRQAIGSSDVSHEGIVGTFDGEFMVEDNGKRHQVPPNYASKTMLVPGDTIRMIEDKDGGQTKYKQIDKVERAKSSGILVKKDGKFEVLTEAGSFKVLSASIKHYNGEVGDLVYVQYPKQHVKGSWAAVEKLTSQSQVSMPEVQPVLAETEEISVSSEQPVVASQVSHQGSPDISEAIAVPMPPKSKVQSAAHKTAKTASKSKSSSQSASKAKRTNPAAGQNSPRTESDMERKVTTQVSAEEYVSRATSAPVNHEGGFEEDDLL